MKTWMWRRKGNLMRETESLLIAAQNNAMRTNHTKARIDKTPPPKKNPADIGYVVIETKLPIT